MTIDSDAEMNTDISAKTKDKKKKKQKEQKVPLHTNSEDENLQLGEEFFNEINEDLEDEHQKKMWSFTNAIKTDKSAMIDDGNDEMPKTLTEKVQ